MLLTEGCWFTPRNNLFLQLWKLTAIYNQSWLKNGVKHYFNSIQVPDNPSVMHFIFFKQDVPRDNVNMEEDGGKVLWAKFPNINSFNVFSSTGVTCGYNAVAYKCS